MVLTVRHLPFHLPASIPLLLRLLPLKVFVGLNELQFSRVLHQRRRPRSSSAQGRKVVSVSEALLLCV